MKTMLPMDVAFGGEFPDGMVVEVYGDSESAKTMVGLGFTQAYESFGLPCVYVDVNGTMEEKMFLDAGCKSVIWLRPESAEDAFGMIEKIRDTASLIVIDTVSSLSGERESIENPMRATVNKALRRAMAQAKDRVCRVNGGTIMVLNQAYIGNHGETTSSRKSLTQYTDVRIQTATNMKRPGEHLVGLKINRTPVNPLLADFRLYIRPWEGFDHGMGMVYTLNAKGLIRSYKGRYKLKGGVSLNGACDWGDRKELAEACLSLDPHEWVAMLRENYFEAFFN